MIINDGKSKEQKDSLATRVQTTINANPKDMAIRERELLDEVNGRVEDPNKRQFIRQLIQTTLRTVPMDLAASTRMDSIDARASVDQNVDAGRVEPNLALALYQNTGAPSSAMAQELGFEKTIQAIQGTDGDFSQYTANLLKGHDRAVDNAMSLWTVKMMMNMARALPDQLSPEQVRDAITEADSAIELADTGATTHYAI